MPDTYSIGKHFETFIESQLSLGRYKDASEVVREGLKLLEERERRLEQLDAAVAEGIADADAGLLYDLDEACEELIAEINALPNRSCA